jgi:hypothetical protein
VLLLLLLATGPRLGGAPLRLRRERQRWPAPRTLSQRWAQHSLLLQRHRLLRALPPRLLRPLQPRLLQPVGMVCRPLRVVYCRLELLEQLLGYEHAGARAARLAHSHCHPRPGGGSWLGLGPPLLLRAYISRDSLMLLRGEAGQCLLGGGDSWQELSQERTDCRRLGLRGRWAMVRLHMLVGRRREGRGLRIWQGLLLVHGRGVLHRAPLGGVM